MIEIGRRKALVTIGGAGLAAILAACGKSGDDSSSSSSSSSTSPTTTGSTATTSGSSAPAGSDLTALFTDAGSCTLTPEETEGPYYFDVDSMRRDIREDRTGQELRLALRVLDASCAPVANAVVDIWHCDADGVYSGFDSAEDATFLRGTQATDANGIVEFVTVYPGWYRGRTVHIHAKVHLDNSTVLTTQLYFDDDFTTTVYERASYAAASGRTYNADDGIFEDELLLTLSDDGDYVRGVLTFNVKA